MLALACRINQTEQILGWAFTLEHSHFLADFGCFSLSGCAEFALEMAHLVVGDRCVEHSCIFGVAVSQFNIV